MSVGGMAKRRGMRSRTSSTQSCGPLGVLGLEEEKVAIGRVAHVGHLPAVDAVGVGDDEAVCGLAKDGLKADHGGGIAGAEFRRSDEVAQHLPAPTLGELVYVADEEQVHAGRTALRRWLASVMSSMEASSTMADRLPAESRRCA